MQCDCKKYRTYVKILDLISIFLREYVVHLDISPKISVTKDTTWSSDWTLKGTVDGMRCHVTTGCDLSRNEFTFFQRVTASLPLKALHHVCVTVG